MIRQIAVAPSTPLVLPGVPGAGDPVMDRLAQASRRVTAGLGQTDVVVVVAGGSRPAVRTEPSTDLRGYGLTGLPAHPLGPPPAEVVPVVQQVVAGLREAHRAGVRDRSGPAGGGGEDRDATGPAVCPDLAVLARLLPLGAPVVGISVPPSVAADGARELAHALAALAEQRSIGVLVAGDLGAGHGPKPPRPEAQSASQQLDQVVVAALDGGRPADLLHIDPHLATASHARAVGALRVLGALLGIVRIGTVVRATGVPFGVGYVVAQGG